MLILARVPVARWRRGSSVADAGQASGCARIFLVQQPVRSQSVQFSKAAGLPFPLPDRDREAPLAHRSTKKDEPVKNRFIFSCGRWDLNPHENTHKILSLACLPIPALPRNEDYDTIFKKNCQHFLKNIHKKIFSKICKNMIDRKPLL